MPEAMRVVDWIDRESDLFAVICSQRLEIETQLYLHLI